MAPLISEAKLRSAFRALSAADVFKAFAAQGETSQNIELFLNLLQRSNDLFFKYPKPSRENLRDQFLSELKVYLQNKDLSEQEKFAEISDVIRRVELGYRKLLSILEKLPARKQPPPVQLSATLKLAAHRLDFVQKRAEKSVEKLEVLNASDELTATTDDGTEFHVDAATTSFIENLGTTLGLYAHVYGWISATDKIVFPALVECNPDEITSSQAVELLATSWRRWERIEQRRRYWGGQFVEIVKGREIYGYPKEALATFEYIPNDEDRYDWIANERFKEYIQQNFAELKFETFADRHAADISGPIKLLPDQFVNLREVNSARLLSTILGTNVDADATRYSGLRIVEWLRGYSVLGEIATLHVDQGASPSERNLVRFEVGALEAELVKTGLSDQVARDFVEKTTFSLRSDDLFDCPLLEMEDRSKLLFVPAVLHADAGVITYSNLTSLGEKFVKKGKRFEQQVMSFFKDKGFAPYSIDAHRGGEQYEIDVIVPWKEYLFLFECKNKGLSGHRPVQSYYFRMERNAFVEQVKRQVKALTTYPDMSLDAGGIDPRTKKIIACVLYEPPYAENGLNDGVYIIDWSSLTRFFSNRYLKSKIPYDLPNGHKFLHRTALYSFWSGDAPAPEDLLRQLENPIQIRIVDSRIQKIESIFVVDESYFGITTEYQRGPLNIYKLGRLLGFNASGVRKEEQIIKRMVGALKTKVKKRQLVNQTREFREMKKRQTD